MSTAWVIIGIIGFCGFVWLKVVTDRAIIWSDLSELEKNIINKEKALKKAYDDALKSGDKALALEKGRAYYASKRESGKLTIYDEQAIQNDLSAMR